MRWGLCLFVGCGGRGSSTVRSIVTYLFTLINQICSRREPILGGRRGGEQYKVNAASRIRESPRFLWTLTNRAFLQLLLRVMMVTVTWGVLLGVLCMRRDGSSNEAARCASSR